MLKVSVTNNVYQEILKKAADLYWKKVFEKSDQGITGEELESFKKQYWQEMEENLLVYEIEKFNPKIKNQDIIKLIENYCTNNEANKNHTLYKGHFPANYISLTDCKTLFNDGYSQALYSDSDLTLIEYCEGDLYIKIFNNIADYKKSLADTKEFYKNY